MTADAEALTRCNKLAAVSTRNGAAWPLRVRAVLDIGEVGEGVQCRWRRGRQCEATSTPDKLLVDGEPVLERALTQQPVGQHGSAGEGGEVVDGDPVGVHRAHLCFSLHQGLHDVGPVACDCAEQRRVAEAVHGIDRVA